MYSDSSDIIYYTPHKVIHFNGNNYIYLACSGAIYMLNDIDYIIVSHEGKSKHSIFTVLQKETNCTEKEFHNELRTFANVGLIDSNSELQRTDVMFDLHRLSGVELLVAQQCNMNCDYCYAKQGEYGMPGIMTWDVAEASINCLLCNSNERIVTVSFFGGEPLIAFNLIEKAVDYCKKKAMDYHKTIKFSITTNGTMINNTISRFLNNNHFYINVSLDGDELSHNKHRKFKNGLGTYYETLNGLKQLDSNNVIIRSTIVPGVGDIASYSNAYTTLGNYDYFWGIDLAQFYELNRLDELKHLLQLIAHKFKHDLSQKSYSQCINNKLIYNIILRYAYFHKRSFYCDALYKGIAIDIAGNMYPCHRFCGKSEWCLGNVLRASRNDLANPMLNSFRLFEDKKCTLCWAANICGGGCPYDNRFSFINYVNMPNEVCNVWKSFYTEILNLYIALTQQDKIGLGLQKSN